MAESAQKAAAAEAELRDAREEHRSLMADASTKELQLMQQVADLELTVSLSALEGPGGLP